MKVTWTTSITAICRDCDWSEDDRSIAVKDARRHSKKTGHKVLIERCIAEHIQEQRNYVISEGKSDV